MAPLRPMVPEIKDQGQPASTRESHRKRCDAERWNADIHGRGFRLLHHLVPDPQHVRCPRWPDLLAQRARAPQPPHKGMATGGRPRARNPVHDDIRRHVIKQRLVARRTEPGVQGVAVRRDHDRRHTVSRQVLGDLRGSLHPHRPEGRELEREHQECGGLRHRQGCGIPCRRPCRLRTQRIAFVAPTRSRGPPPRYGRSLSRPARSIRRPAFPPTRFPSAR